MGESNIVKFIYNSTDVYPPKQITGLNVNTIIHVDVLGALKGRCGFLYPTAMKNGLPDVLRSASFSMAMSVILPS